MCKSHLASLGNCSLWKDESLGCPSSAKRRCKGANDPSQLKQCAIFLMQTGQWQCDQIWACLLAELPCTCGIQTRRQDRAHTHSRTRAAHFAEQRFQFPLLRFISVSLQDCNYSYHHPPTFWVPSFSFFFSVLKVLKGKLPRKLRRHVRLMYQQENEDEKVNPLCEFPVKFDVKANRKYLIFIKRLGPARYVAIAKPEVWTKDVRRIAKKTLCEGCGKPEKTETSNYPRHGWTVYVEYLSTYANKRPLVVWCGLISWDCLLFKKR